VSGSWFRLLLFVAGIVVAAGCAGSKHTAGARGSPKPRVITVTSTVMEPTLRCAGKPGCSSRRADRVDFVAPSGQPRRRTIVVVRPPRREGLACPRGLLLERVVGVPGDLWEERRGLVFIDGHRLSEFYIRADRRERRTIAPTRIPRGHYFVMGDNRLTRCDSRGWGALPSSRIVGVFLALRRSR
jgi:signal peptidase I